MKPKPLLGLNHFTVPIGMDTLYVEVAQRESAQSIKLSVGETRTGAPCRGCRGLTQVEFDAASMVGAAGNSKGARLAAGLRKQKRPKRASAVFPGKKTNRLRCRAPTVRSSAASRIAGCSRSRATFRTSAA